MDDYEVEGPITNPTAKVAERFKVGDRGSYFHYMESVDGSDGNQISLYHLVRKSDGSVVGFMKVKNCIEDLGDDYPANAWCSVEYVYIVPELRGQGLSVRLIEKALQIFASWLQTKVAALGADRIVVMSGSVGGTSSGFVFASRLHSALRQWCMERSVRFQWDELPN